MGESDAANSWKEMFYEALSSMKGLEKEIIHKDREIQLLNRRIRVSETGRVIPPASSEPKENLMDEMKDLQDLAHNLNSKLIATEARLQQSLERNAKLEVSCGKPILSIMTSVVVGLANLRFARVLRGLNIPSIYLFLASHPDYQFSDLVTVRDSLDQL
jgi:hypothetical protein